MQINDDSAAAIIALEMDILRHKIEALPAHVEYTNALNAATAARDALIKGRGDLHHRNMRARYATAGWRCR